MKNFKMSLENFIRCSAEKIQYFMRKNIIKCIIKSKTSAHMSPEKLQFTIFEILLLTRVRIYFENFTYSIN